MNAYDLYILSGCLASSATPLTVVTVSMEDIHICNSVCLRYVDDKKLSVFQSNVKYLKLKLLVIWLVKRVSSTSFNEEKNIFCTRIASMCGYHQWFQVAAMTQDSKVRVKIFAFRAIDMF